MIVLITIIINLIIKNKEKRRSKILTGTQEANLQTNDHDPRTTASPYHATPPRK